MGDVGILPNLTKKGKVFKNVGYSENHKKLTTIEVKKELERNKVGIAFMEGTNYEYAGIVLQVPQSGLFPVECFKIIN